MRSPSARKVWIEIEIRRGLQGAERGHLPQGRCGLKCGAVERRQADVLSPSARKVWIEIYRELFPTGSLQRHLPQGRCGLKSPERTMKHRGK